MESMQPIYNLETQHDTAAGTMTHTITNRVQVVAHIKKGEILVLVDGNIVNTYRNMSVKEYEARLLEVEEHAYQLERKDKIKNMLCKVAVYAIICVAILALFALSGDNDEWSMGMFAAQKAGCLSVMAGCYYVVKHTPALAAAWKSIDNNIKE